MNQPQVVFQSRGVIEGDPLEGLPIGSSITFLSISICAEIEDAQGALANWDAFNSILLAIAFVKGVEHQVLGSAVLVAPGLALCAAHVISPEIDDLVAGRIAGLCQGIGPHGVDLWWIRKVTTLPNTDLCLLGLELASALPPGGVFHQAVITTRTPREGERLLMCGFTASEPTFPALPGQQVRVSGKVRFAKGPVLKTYPTGRDSAVLPWPAIEVDCFAHGGMSGGPVFDSSGALIGLVCTSLETERDHGVSWVSMIWPSLSVATEHVWPPGLVPTPTSLIDMPQGLCQIIRPEAIQWSEIAPGRIRAAYMPWHE